MSGVNLDELSRWLKTKGFETVISDNVLAASKTGSGKNLEINIDAGGGCLAKVTRYGRKAVKKTRILGQALNVIQSTEFTSQVRLNINSEKNLSEIADYLENEA